MRSADGKDVGKIRSVIIDPADLRVRAVVIEKGFLLPDDVVAPIESLVLGPESDTRLNRTADQVHDLPRFDVADYTNPPDEAAVSLGFPAGAMLWPIGGLYPGSAVAAPGVGLGAVDVARASRDQGQEVEAEREREASQELTAAVREGADVLSSEGEKVGELHRLAFDAVSGRPLACTVREGFLFPKDIELPGELIGSVGDDAVRLTINRDELEEWIRRPGDAPV